VLPLLTDEYVNSLYYRKPRPKGSILAGYAARILECIRNSKVDLVWIERELLPWLPAFLERIVMGRCAAPYVLDLDDAVFHYYDLHRLAFVRRALGRKIDEAMSRAAMVIVGNQYLGTRAVAAGATCVEYLPTVVDAVRYRAPHPKSCDELTVGWIGTPMSVGNLELAREALMALSRKCQVRLVVVGAELRGWDGLRVESVPWTEESEAALLSEFDIGIMPLADGALERGKCGYKLIQYMAAGVAVIATPVGANKTIVQNEVNGFLADSAGEWIRAFEALAASQQLRNEMGQRGRESVLEHYSLAKGTERLADLLRRAAQVPDARAREGSGNAPLRVR
jgi:glycosyltransferase involved in cell wall biosynthesis